MAKTVIEVNTGTLRTDVTNIQGEIRSLRSEAGKLRSAADQLSGMWDGPAKQAFMSAVKDDLGRLDALIQAMEKFTVQTSDAREEYDKCENAVSGIISAIRV